MSKKRNMGRDADTDSFRYLVHGVTYVVRATHNIHGDPVAEINTWNSFIFRGF